MHYLSAENITKSYGITPLFENISFNINEGDKIALIARNGVGKSTLLKIIAGKETLDEGKIWVHKDVTVALFEQNPDFEEKKSVLENVLHIEHPTIQLIKLYEAALQHNDQQALTDLVPKMNDAGAWDFEYKVKEILGKLNITEFDQTLQTMSGGQRKRVALAKTLIDIGFEHKHTLLMMDEPTNHLDVEMIEWLENYLNHEKITLLLVTHDRYFLDATCNQIWELEKSSMYVYRGDYDNYLEKKAQRIENEMAGIDKAKNLYRKELEWMRKQPRARTTKSKARQDNFYSVEEKAKQKITDNKLELNMKMARLGGKILELKKVYKSYGDLSILKGFDYTFSKGERIGIVGKNGTGKSTFLNILQGLENPDSGKINVGDTVVFGNYSQQGLEIKENVRVIEYVKSFAENFPLAKGGSLSAAQFLELFLFSPEKQFTFLESLSGGEKKRLQLLTILFKNPNFLILDEPTNDLDLPTLNVLENFLIEYPGCVLIVSHDRYFMDKLVNHLFVFEGNGNITDYPGNYSQYRVWQKEKEQKEKIAQQQSAEKNIQQKEEINTVEKKKASYKEKREFELLEAEIAELEAEKSQLESELSNPDADYESLTRYSKRINDISLQLEEKEMRWLELSEFME